MREELNLEAGVEKTYTNTIQDLQGRGFTVIEIEIPHLDYVVPAYYTIATAEASANLARFNGVRYGHRPEYAENPEELVRMSRDEGFGDEVKMRILLGTFVLRSGFQEQYYQKAQKIRTALRMDFENAFKKVDLIMTPTFPVSAFKHGDSTMDAFQQKLADRYTSTANLAGIPALSFPAGIEDGLPVGMQFLAPPFAEDRLFQAARAFEKDRSMPYPPDFEPSWLTERSR
jgi:aspartyl-tRNA(Asn)/glutamyl-tRNA(Gln) amidotransferase subunit A